MKKASFSTRKYFPSTRAREIHSWIHFHEWERQVRVKILTHDPWNDHSLTHGSLKFPSNYVKNSLIVDNANAKHRVWMQEKKLWVRIRVVAKLGFMNEMTSVASNDSGHNNKIIPWTVKREALAMEKINSNEKRRFKKFIQSSFFVVFPSLVNGFIKEPNLWQKKVVYSLVKVSKKLFFIDSLFFFYFRPLTRSSLFFCYLLYFARSVFTTKNVN